VTTGPGDFFFIDPPSALSSPGRAEVSGAVRIAAAPAFCPHGSCALVLGAPSCASALTTKTLVGLATKAPVAASSGCQVAALPLRKPTNQKRPRHYSQQYRVVTINVDGCGSLTYKDTPAHRMKKLVQKLLPLEPDAICFQEVTDVLFESLRSLLSSWCTFRKEKSRGEYYLATFSKEKASSGHMTCKPVSFYGCTEQGRHMLVVRHGALTLINVHAESNYSSRTPLGLIEPS